jgi:hypothetical protein
MSALNDSTYKNTKCKKKKMYLPVEKVLSRDYIIRYVSFRRTTLQ